MNHVVLIGNLTRDPEIRTTQSGKSVCSFGLAVNRRRKVEGQPEADFFNVTAWETLGENCHRYLLKGRKCAVSGEVQIRQYDASDGTRRTSVDIIARDVEFLPSGERREAGAAYNAEVPAEKQGFAQVDEDELPF